MEKYQISQATLTTLTWNTLYKPTWRLTLYRQEALYGPLYIPIKSVMTGNVALYALQ